MLLADPDQIASLSKIVDDPNVSFLAEKSAEFKKNRGDAEEIFMNSPDLVVAGVYTEIATVQILQSLGVRVEIFPIEQNFEDIIKNMGGGALGGTDFEGGGFGKTVGAVTEGLKEAIQDKGFRRRQQLNLIAAAGKTLGLNVNVDQALNRKFGVVQNPNLELLFTGPQLRDFTFMFRFSPRSSDESAKVRMIIRTLKQHMATKKNPKRGAKSESTGNWLLGTPDVFKLRYIKAKTQQDIKGLNKFKTCALKSINVDYTGGLGRFAAYDEDSQPITTFVTLTFGELVPLYDQDYLEFDSHDDVGL